MSSGCFPGKQVTCFLAVFPENILPNSLAAYTLFISRVAFQSPYPRIQSSPSRRPHLAQTLKLALCGYAHQRRYLGRQCQSLSNDNTNANPQASERLTAHPRIPLVDQSCVSSANKKADIETIPDNLALIGRQSQVVFER